MAYVVYILYSPSLGRFYVGPTEDLVDRLIRHNSGGNKSAKAGVPWTLVHSEHLPDRVVAIVKEKQIKDLGARRCLKSIDKEFGTDSCDIHSPPDV
ncbi:MAG: GIY-YIG nuclease family protein [Lunatimonas sp.]|uniref:GIY-YIG nuclease family protein n=1 Tax=Lunatimonas sp. TaxID=2060141 RepID=UPI00263B2010|nr:GIY-YIG nuclease family protein [Lunatimonas sp.]MCC5935745.1 GIY-YIG nuclease family protein [Lunatimonas sp.]